MTWDALGGRVQGSIFSNRERALGAIELLLCRLFTLSCSFPQRDLAAAATAQFIVGWSFAISGLDKEAYLGQGIRFLLKVLFNPYQPFFSVFQIPSTKAGELPLIIIIINNHFGGLVFTQLKLFYQNQPFLPKSEPLQGCDPGTCMFTCADSAVQMCASLQVLHTVATNLQPRLESRNVNQFLFNALLKGRACRVPRVVSSSIFLKMQSM